MRCVDVNVLINAHRVDGLNHNDVRLWLEGARRGLEPLGIPSVVASGFLRIVTHPRIFKEPSPPSVAWAFINALYASPSVVRLDPEKRHWDIFSRLGDDLELRGNDLPDAFIAAIALEHGATVVTADRAFARFPGVRIERPTTP